MSESSPTDPIAWLKGLAESARRIQLAPGVLGKTHTVILGIMAIWLIVIFRLSSTELYLDAGMFAGAGIATYVGVVWCAKSRDFAIANPALALMEGADITEHQKFEAQAKGLSHGDRRPILDPTKPTTLESPQTGPDTDV